MKSETAEVTPVVAVDVSGLGVEAAGRIQARVAEGGEAVALVEVEEDVGGGELAGAGVEVEVPLDVRVGGGADAQAGDERGDLAGLGEEGDAGEIEGGVEDVAAAVDDGTAEGLDRRSTSG